VARRCASRSQAKSFPVGPRWRLTDASCAGDRRLRVVPQRSSLARSCLVHAACLRLRARPSHRTRLLWGPHFRPARSAHFTGDPGTLHLSPNTSYTSTSSAVLTAMSGLTSRRASYVVPCTTGMSCSRARSSGQRSPPGRAGQQRRGDQHGLQAEKFAITKAQGSVRTSWQEFELYWGGAASRGASIPKTRIRAARTGGEGPHPTESRHLVTEPRRLTFCLSFRISYFGYVSSSVKERKTIEFIHE
jgi:hypothetical protein